MYGYVNKKLLLVDLGERGIKVDPLITPSKTTELEHDSL